MPKAEDLTGRRFGKYVVTGRAPTVSGNVRWLCRCDCGATRSVQAGTLRAGTARSCGCALRELRRPAVVAGGVVEIRLTKGLTAIVDEADRCLADANWSAQWTNGGHYAARNVDGKRVLLHRAVAARAGHVIDGIEVDHENGDRLDCRRRNLRPATHAQNGKNLPLARNNTSGFKGVGWHAHSRSWHARIVADGAKISLGYWPTREAAAQAYAEASRRLHGEFGRVA